MDGEVLFAVDGEGVDSRVVGKNGGGAVALVYITIEDDGALQMAGGLQAAQGDGDIVEDAEALTPIWPGVVGAAGEGGRQPFLQGGAAGADGATDGMAAALHHAARPGEADAADVLVAQLAAEDAADIAGIVG